MTALTAASIQARSNVTDTTDYGPVTVTSLDELTNVIGARSASGYRLGAMTAIQGDQGFEVNAVLQAPTVDVVALESWTLAVVHNPTVTPPTATIAASQTVAGNSDYPAAVETLSADGWELKAGITYSGADGRETVLTFQRTAA